MKVCVCALTNCHLVHFKQLVQSNFWRLVVVVHIT